ncbi:hypothetical protein FBU30_008547 [Linnemannia zychae]|nr:hypothetical protein FBU30_008547 [Linnemannia zychae]
MAYDYGHEAPVVGTIEEIDVEYVGKKRILAFDCEELILKLSPVQVDVTMTVYFFDVVAAEGAVVAVEGAVDVDIDVPGLSEIPLNVLQLESPEIEYSHKS